MAAPEHRFVPKPRQFSGKVRGRAIGCSCGAMTFVSEAKTGIRWHAQHRVEESKPERVLERVTAELPEVEARLAALVA